MGTREKILNVAEGLFAEKGFESVSVREIIKEAEVNISAVNYHFGSKDDLIFEVVKRRIDVVNDRRLKDLEKLKAEYLANPVPLRKILEAFICPVFAFGKEDKKQGSKFMQLMGRVTSNTNSRLKDRVYSLFGDVIKSFIPEIVRSCPDVPAKVIAHRFYFAVGSMAHTLMNQKVPAELASRLKAGDESVSQSEDLDLDSLEKELIDFLIGGINASV